MLYSSILNSADLQREEDEQFQFRVQVVLACNGHY